MRKRKRYKKTPITRDSKPSTPPSMNKKSYTMDAFSNAMARLGYGSDNLLEGTEYPMTRLTQNYQLMNSLYRSHWIVRKVIDTIPEDMCKNWISIKSQIKPEQIERIEKLERTTKIKRDILAGLKWGRLYGGAGAVIIIKGHEDMLDKPLDYDDIMPDSFKGLIVADRWSGLTPGAEVIEDVSSPEFGLPLYYEWFSDGQTTRVHNTRVIRFTGRDLPFWEQAAETGWGESEVEVIYDELKKRDNTSYNIAQLVFSANLKVLQMSDLGQTLSLGDEDAQKDILTTVQAQNQLMSSAGMLLMDKDDSFTTHQYSFGGLNEIYESFMLDISGACDIPVTKLFGRSPGGLNSTGEGDQQNYYDTVGQKQEAQLRPALDKLLPIMFISEFGSIPDDLDYAFNPIETPSDADVADLASKKTTAVNDVFQSGLISQQIGQKELRQMSDTTGMFTNITDEDIENADDGTESFSNDDADESPHYQMATNANNSDDE